MSMIILESGGQSSEVKIPARRDFNVSNSSILTKQDISIIDRSLEMNVDYIQVGNVSRKEDLNEVRELIVRKQNTKLLVNIEHPDLIDRLDEILSVCHGVVICRNWLSAFVPERYNTEVQKSIINKCKTRGKLVVVKGMILESMRSSFATVINFAEMNDLISIVQQAPDGVLVEKFSNTEKEQMGRCVQGLRSILE